MVNYRSSSLLLLLAGAGSVYGLPQSRVKEGYSPRRLAASGQRRLNVGNDPYSGLLHSVCDAFETHGGLPAALTAMGFSGSTPGTPTIPTSLDGLTLLVLFKKSLSDLLHSTLSDIGAGCTYFADDGNWQ